MRNIESMCNTNSVCDRLKKITAGAAAFLMIFMLALPVSAGGMVVPGGQSIGVSLSFSGAYIDDLGQIETSSGRSSPAEKAGITAGETIVGADGSRIDSVEDFSEFLSRCGDGREICLSLRARDGGVREVTVQPVRDEEDGRLKIGAWLMDAASGIGTVTYYDPQSGAVAGVGHSISEVTPADDGGSIGHIYRADIAGVRKGEPGTPGELIGIYSENKLEIGEIYSCSRYGIIGSVKNTENLISTMQAIPTGSRDEIGCGSAEIVSNIEGNKIKNYKIEITEVNKSGDDDKDIIFRVTDEELLEKTGGIVRGMSGSPIIQNERLVGAVTHVMVSDPALGYGTFIENMKK